VIDKGHIVGRTRVKICGITSPEDALIAVANGADAIGLVFWQPSPRSVSLQQAKAICSQLPAFVSVVGLVVDADDALITDILRSVSIDVLQFHGNETPEQCLRYGHPFIKAIRMRPELDISAEIASFSMASSILLDAYQKGVPGGTGERFDWQRIPADYRSEIILAGGLTADNVTDAIATVRPYAVDVSGGVEASHGVKDSLKIEAFFEGVRQADQC
jgi:phosphoribosylanthranilate isomerase